MLALYYKIHHSSPEQNLAGKPKRSGTRLKVSDISIRDISQLPQEQLGRRFGGMRQALPGSVGTIALLLIASVLWAAPDCPEP